MQPGTLYYGDCLDWMERWPDECVDLIYLDPPFNSNANYNVLYSTEAAGDAQMRAFEDTWQWNEAAGERMARFEGAIAHPLHDAVCALFRLLGPSGMMAYLSYMAERLLPTRRLLRPTGAIYLHCNPTASHYLKVLMDAIYGGGGFSEISWQRTSSHNDGAQGRRQFGRIRDVILHYTPGPSWTWNPQYTPYDQTYLDRFYRHVEPETGRRYQLDKLTAPGGAAKGNPRYSVMGITRYWAYSKERMEELIAAGRVVQTAPERVPRYKRYLDEMPGKPLQDQWTDIPPVAASSRERLGYQTQKPVALLERILSVSSNEGDVVLDPFCGCGTAIEAAHRLNRQWVGIDISPFAIDLIRNRRLKDLEIPAEGIPSSLESARMLARERPFDFETWAITRLPGFAPNQRQVGDGGVDGRGRLADQPEDLDSRLALAQVKGGKFTASGFRDFLHVLHRDKAAVGCFLTLDPAPASARADAKRFGTLTVAGQRYDRLHPFSIRDYFEDRPPHLPAMLDPYTGKPVYQMALL